MPSQLDPRAACVPGSMFMSFLFHSTLSLLLIAITGFEISLMAGAFAVFAGTTAWAVSRHHVRVVERRYRTMAEERSRRAQELNDAMLQGFLGVAWQIEAASTQLPAHPGEAKEQITQLLRRLDGVLQEARQGVWDLRHPHEEASLEDVLAKLKQEMFGGEGMECVIATKGVARKMPMEVAHSLVYVAREAWANVLRHAGATAVKTELRYEPECFEMEIRDNGKGLLPATTSYQPGRWGIACMQQRVARLEGEFSISGLPGEGTLVRVRLDGSTAYARNEDESWWRRN